MTCLPLTPRFTKVQMQNTTYTQFHPPLQVNLLSALGLIDEANVEGRLTAAPAVDGPMAPSGAAPK